MRPSWACGQRLIHLEGLGPDGAELSITVRGRAPLPIELRANARDSARDPIIADVMRRLPPWATATSMTVRVVRLDL